MTLFLRALCAAIRAAKAARMALASPAPSGGPPCVNCGDDALAHAVDDEERRECMVLGCGCRQYECSKAGA